MIFHIYHFNSIIVSIDHHRDSDVVGKGYSRIFSGYNYGFLKEKNEFILHKSKKRDQLLRKWLRPFNPKLAKI